MKLPTSIPHTFTTALVLHSTASAIAQVKDSVRNITYQGFTRNGMDSFLNIPFGQDTSGPRRFTAPKPFVPAYGTIFNNTVSGPICPQDPETYDVYLSDPINQSEDCLNLQVVKPSSAVHGSKLPVMVFIYGGGLRDGSAYERTQTGEGLVYQSIENDLPVLYVAMNYRMTIFGFALSEALRSNKSLNAGLRDQRLALEWVRDNIEWFGGDPDRVTIFGQSSGGLSVTTQILAYGGSQKAPFHRAICESTALEPGITANLTLDSFNGVAWGTGCVRGDPQSLETLECLRSLPMETLLNITLTQADSNSSINNGDVYLPILDGDFLPAAPSELIRTGRFTPVSFIGGWTLNDDTLFTPFDIATETDTINYVTTMYPHLTNTSLTTILSLYPSTDFVANTTAGMASEFYRSAQIVRDILLVCPNFYLGHAISQKCLPSSSTHTNPSSPSSCSRSSISGSPEAPVYYYEQNQTILTSYLESSGMPGLGVVHTSELPYVFGNLSVYNTSAYSFFPSEADYALARRQSRSWSTFAYSGTPVGDGETLKGWAAAYEGETERGMMDARLFVVGGGEEGLSGLEGERAREGVRVQRLKERCEFFNSEEIMAQLKY